MKTTLFFPVFLAFCLTGLVWGEGNYEVRTLDGVPRLCVDGVPVRPRMFYGAHYPIRLAAGPEVETVAANAPEFSADGVMDAQVRLAADAGVDFITFDAPIWADTEAGVDFSVLDRMADMVLAGNPEAKLIPRVYVNASAAWLDAHPTEEIVRRNRDGSIYHGGRYDRVASVASRAYRQDAAERLEKTVRHLEERYGASFAGIHPAGQNSCEWFTPMSWADNRFGYSVCERESFRRYVAEQYGTDEALQQAWGDSSVTRATADVPTLEAWAQAEAATWLDTAMERRFQQILDFHAWTQKEMTDTVLEMSAAARRGMRQKKLVLVFYGYTFEFSAMAGGPAKSAHYDLRRILASSDVDMICSPLSYADRRAGGTEPIMLPAESILLAGKLYVQEDDTRTPRTTEPYFLASNVGAENVEELQALLRRNTAMAILRNYGSWWMDLGGSGWYNDARFWEPMKQLAALDAQFLKEAHPFQPALGLFVEENSLQAAAHGENTRTTYNLRAVLGRTGFSYGQYLLDDLLEGRVPWVRVCVIPAATRLTTQQRNALRKTLRGRTVFWLGEPGVLDYHQGSGGDFRFLTELTGFQVQPLDVPHPRRLAIQTQDGDQVLKTYPSGQAATVLRQERSGGTSVFLGENEWGPELLEPLRKALRKECAISLWWPLEPTEDPRYAQSVSSGLLLSNGSFGVLHGTESGNVWIHCTERETMSQRFLKKGETQILWDAGVKPPLEKAVSW